MYFLLKLLAWIQKCHTEIEKWHEFGAYLAFWNNFLNYLKINISSFTYLGFMKLSEIIQIAIQMGIF